MCAPQTDEHYRHDGILGEFTLILGWVLLGFSIAILSECNPYPLCTQLWDQRYWRPALKCRSHSFQEKNILSLNHFRSGLACSRVGQWRGGGKSWPRTGVNFMDQGWNPVHTPVVESELSPTWNYIQIASPEYVGPSLWPPPDRERKEDVDMVWPRSVPLTPTPQVQRILRSGSQGHREHVHTSGPLTWALSPPLQWGRKGRSVTCEGGLWELVSFHLFQRGEEDPGSFLLPAVCLPTSQLAGRAKPRATPFPAPGHLWEARAGL